MSHDAADDTPFSPDRAPKDPPLWPKERAFVLQLSSDSDPATGRLVGRLEQVGSGRVGRFDSVAGLLAALAQALGAPLEPAADGANAPEGRSS